MGVSRKSVNGGALCELAAWLKDNCPVCFQNSRETWDPEQNPAVTSRNQGQSAHMEEMLLEGRSILWTPAGGDQGISENGFLRRLPLREDPCRG